MERIKTETTVEFDTTELARLIGDQLILDGRGEPFAYLAGIALEGIDSDRDIVEILMEYVNNEEQLDLSYEQQANLRRILRDAHNE